YFFDPAWRDVSATRIGGINEEILLDLPRYGPFAQDDSVWTIVRERENEMTLGLINLRGVTARWNEAKPKPRPLRALSVSIRLQRKLVRAYYVTPEQNTRVVPLRLDTANGTTHLTVPRLDVWGMVILQFE